jgi:hypothetical protein
MRARIYIPSRLAGMQTLEAPLRSERALEMLWHAYNYVRGLNVEGASSAAALLLSNYRELKRKQRQCGRKYGRG